MAGRHLTPRQLEVLRCVALGMSDKQAAAALGITVPTQRQNMSRIREKLGQFDRLQVPGMALVLGLVSIADICRPALVLLQDLDPRPDDTYTRGLQEPAD